MKQLITPLLCLFAIPVFGQTVNFDLNFGASGIAITPNTSEITQIATDPDGFIYSAGYSLESGSFGVYHLTLTKHTGAGILVPGFGTNGLVTTAIDHSEFPLDITLQPDGKILVCGSVYLGPTQNGPGDYNSFIVRYDTNGELDNSFATNGILKLPHSDSHLTSIILLDDGSILLAGNSYGAGAITRITSNGVIDYSFGNNGTVFLSGANFQFVMWKALLLSDQAIICVGYDTSDSNNSKLAYCKINQNGDFIPIFGQNGKVVLDLHNSMPEVDEYLSIIKQSAIGEIIIGGQSPGPIILKVDSFYGSLDPNFGDNGILRHSYPFADMEILNDGKFLIGGSQEISAYNYGFSITRLNSDGSLDPGFNNTGTFTADISPGNDYLQTLKPVGTSGILIGGSSPFAGPNSDFMLVKIHSEGNLSITESQHEEIVVYPNPFSDDVYFSIPESEFSEIQLTDAAGRVITTLKSSENKLNLGHLSKGMYRLTFTKPTGETSFQTVVKQ